jgi:proteic killer suppression protein
VIRSFRHSGLREYWETRKSRRLNPQCLKRIWARLVVLNTAANLEEIDLPGFRLHELSGERAGTWAVNVTGNYRITFRPDYDSDSEGDEAFDVWDVDLEDYH